MVLGFGVAVRWNLHRKRAVSVDDCASLAVFWLHEAMPSSCYNIAVKRCSVLSTMEEICQAVSLKIVVKLLDGLFVCLKLERK